VNQKEKLRFNQVNVNTKKAINLVEKALDKLMNPQHNEEVDFLRKSLYRASYHLDIANYHFNRARLQL